MVSHSSAAAISERDWISPVQRFPIFGGEFKVLFLGAAEGIAETWESKESTDRAAMRPEVNILKLLQSKLCLNFRGFILGSMNAAESLGPTGSEDPTFFQKAYRFF